MAYLLPKPLKYNSTIGLICPAGGFDDYKPIRLVVKYLKKKGFNVKLGKSLFSSGNAYKYLSGSDSKRLLDLHNFCNDKTVDAIFALRGGYGSLRLLKDIDFNLIRKSKKIILGFSDITVLLLAIYSKCRLITFHGPLLGIKFINKDLEPLHRKSDNNLWKVLHDPKFKFSYSNKSEGLVIYPGKASGKLLGGNLTDICSMIGSGFLPDFKDSILFLEDCYEEPYKIDRLLTQIHNAGIFSKVNGVIFSSFYKCGFKNDKEVKCLLKDRMASYKIPVVYNFPVGHDLGNYTLPIGMPCVLDANAIALYNYLI